MLGKLMKHEFKATGRYFVPMYLILAGVTVLFKIVLEIIGDTDVDNGLMRIIFIFMSITYVVAMIGLLFGTVVLILKRFYDNMLKDEGYLSFTLPVTTGQHMVSKILVSYIWTLASILMEIVSVAVVFAGHGIWKAFFEDFGDLIQLIKEMGYWGVVIEFIALMLVTIYVYIIMGYTCFSVGQRYNKHRILGALITYAAIYGINQIVNLIAMVTLGLGVDDEASIVSEFFQPTLTWSLAFSVVEAVIFTIVTHYMLNKKLNLE